jgi:hypothetical protein
MSKEAIEFKVKGEAQYEGEVTDAQIAKWKGANTKGIFSVVSEGGTHIGYFREPFRGDVNLALTKVDDKRPLASIEAFGELLWLGGSEEIMKNDAMWLGTTTLLRGKMNGEKMRLVNL